MSCGNEFVETLKKIGYPKADILNGEDFDWLFEDVEDESFLKWFCGNVNEQNVLSEKELEAFSDLQRSGKPILEGTALDEVLRTCKTFDLKTCKLDDKEIQILEDEVQTLQKLNNSKIQRRNKYQLMVSETSYRFLALNAKQEEATKKLKQKQGFLNSVNTKLSNELQGLTEEVNNLMIFFRNSNLSERTNPMVFLSQFPLGKYISQEEQSTAALTLYTKKQLSQRNTVLCQHLAVLSDIPASEQLTSRTPIDTKDHSTHRLYELLEGDNKKKELFITHEHLEEVAEKLKQDVSVIQDQLAVSTQEHFFFLSKLNNDVDMLCDALYRGGNQLLLCDQELKEHFHQVESQLNELHHLLTDILADVKTKRRILATNKLHQVER